MLLCVSKISLIYEGKSKYRSRIVAGAIDRILLVLSQIQWHSLGRHSYKRQDMSQYPEGVWPLLTTSRCHQLSTALSISFYLGRSMKNKFFLWALEKKDKCVPFSVLSEYEKCDNCTVQYFCRHACILRGFLCLYSGI